MLGKMTERFIDRFGDFSPLEGRQYVRLLIAHVIEGIEGLVVFLIPPTGKTEEFRATLATCPFFRNNVRRYRVQIGRKLSGRLVAGTVLHQREKDLLGQLLGDVTVLYHAIGIVEDAALMAMDQYGIGLFRPFSMLQHQRFVGPVSEGPFAALYNA